MLDYIAKIAVVREDSQAFTPTEERGLEDYLDYLLCELRSTPRVAADSLLDRLGEFQTELARAAFKWHVPLPERLRTLVREYDRCDDPEVRSETFERIQANTFLRKS